MSAVELTVGQEVHRKTLHETFAGRRNGGISPSTRANVVMLFVAGGNDLTGWGTDGTFHFMGEGQVGDQVMAQGNRSVLRHKEDGRELHLFERLPDKGLHRYLGRFELDNSKPWYQADAPDTQGSLRSVIVFRLHPVGVVAADGPSLPFTPQSFAELRPEAVTVDEAPPQRLHRAVQVAQPKRREAQLVSSYARHLRAHGHEVSRAQIMQPGEARSAFIDLMDLTENRLIAVRPNVTRESIRFVIGELLDFRRHFSPTPMLVALVPERPRDDLVDLCSSLCIEVVWPMPGEGGFVSSYD